MRRSGGLWRFDYQGRVIYVPHTKGMHYLALLLSAPGLALPALDLEARASQAAGARAADADAAAQDGLSVRQAPHGALTALDETAKADYRRRMDDLREDIEEAERWHDAERAARAREELAFIAREISAAVGLGGHDRPIGSNAERARQNVTRAIGTAKRIIEEQDADLAHEFSRVKTGAACMYEPTDPRRPLSWQVEFA